MTSILHDIPLTKLIPSKANVRRTGQAERIDELAASIASRGVLQNLVVCPVEGDRFEVVAGGRRLRALRLLAKQKRFPKDGLVRCMVRDTAEATEVSLAENVTQAQMHPADQFEAFAKLREEGIDIEDIAARFGVSAHMVKQRLKLAAVSGKLMKIYRSGGMSLDQLTGFTITDDTKKQERVWTSLAWDKGRGAILRALSEGQVKADDRRVQFIGLNAYEAAGGNVVRDLFDLKGGGFLVDAELLDQLVAGKLAGIAETVSAEGWKWARAEVEIDYGEQAIMRRIYPIAKKLTEEEQALVDTLNEKLEGLCDASGDEPSEEMGAEIARLQEEIASIEGEPAHDAEEMKIAGAFISIGPDGQARISRGFIKPEDDASRWGEAGAPKPTGDRDALPESLKVELSVFRTAGLANELAKRPDVALLAVIHALAARVFFPHEREVSALSLAFTQPRLVAAAENRAMIEREARHAAWATRMPEAAASLWGFVVGLPEAERLDLLAHCTSLSVDAVLIPKGEPSPAVAMLAEAVTLDMSGYWQPTAEGYFARVSKSRTMKDVREATSNELAQTCEDMKKADMARRAAQLVDGKGWLPEALR
jgi:ParB family transcriptional regulator, chromosome partitioning protein